jgi:multidrug transporter EmrE-like cation transporter
MFDTVPLLYGVSMAAIDVVILSLLKLFNIGAIRGLVPIIGAMLVYALQPILFLKSLSFSSLTVMNLLWDVSSDVLVTLVGLFYFKEELSTPKKLGVGLSLISIFLLSYNG